MNTPITKSLEDSNFLHQQQWNFQKRESITCVPCRLKLTYSVSFMKIVPAAGIRCSEKDISGYLETTEVTSPECISASLYILLQLLFQTTTSCCFWCYIIFCYCHIGVPLSHQESVLLSYYFTVVSWNCTNVQNNSEFHLFIWELIINHLFYVAVMAERRRGHTCAKREASAACGRREDWTYELCCRGASRDG